MYYVIINYTINTMEVSDMIKTLSIRLSEDKYKLTKILLKIKDISFNEYVNDLITKDLKLNIDKIKQYQKIFKGKS